MKMTIPKTIREHWDHPIREYPLTRFSSLFSFLQFRNQMQENLRHFRNLFHLPGSLFYCIQTSLHWPRKLSAHQEKVRHQTDTAPFLHWQQLYFALCRPQSTEKASDRLRIDTCHLWSISYHRCIHPVFFHRLRKLSSRLNQVLCPNPLKTDKFYFPDLRLHKQSDCQAK